MSNQNRDDFTERTKLQIAKRVGWLCSDPSCRRPTIGSTSDGDGEINLGTAAHICAAAPGGPRYDSNQTREQRRSADNGMWMCKLHGTAVDTKDSKFTVELLREWKAQAQRDSWRRVLYDDVPQGPGAYTPTEGELSTRLRTAAAADLDVFRNSAKWPSTAIDLTLEVNGLSGPVSTSALATALVALDDLILVAPPGMGKTTTLFQIAEAMLSNGNASPIIVPLGDWSTDDMTLIESILKRHTFREVSEDDLRIVASKPGVVLLLDGWNELDTASRKRLTVQVTRLQTELPKLGFLVSTRKQVLDVPVNGTRINLLPLSETQQLDISKSLRGDAGARIIDQAWRTDGIRELVTIPLYLTALLALPGDTLFPATKEEILRRFVIIHEEDAQRDEALMEVMLGLHQRFLEDLAVNATRAMNTTITEIVARKSVSDTDRALVVECQITEMPRPNLVLETLVNYHVLMRVGDPAGYSFQHQQFQEWYASHFVERLMFESVSDAACRDTLKAEVLNQPTWEEAILFACERLSRGDLNQQKACGASILAALEVDSMLAAEMIFCSTDAIWAPISTEIQEFVERWHKPGKVDRAFRFMLSTGRPEFFDQVWSLITHEDDQVHLAALCASKPFRPSVLGKEAAKWIATLSSKIRQNVLHEIAFNSGIDGLDLATAIAKEDPEPEVKSAVVDALAFRRANRHVVDVLLSADGTTFDLVVQGDLLDYMDVGDENVKTELVNAYARKRKQGFLDHERLRLIAYGQGDEDFSGELVSIIGELEIDTKKDWAVNLIYMARNRYPREVAEGLLLRLRGGQTLFYGTSDLLVSAGLMLEDEDLIEIALSDTDQRDDRAEAAVAALGPKGVGRVIKAFLAAKKNLRHTKDKHGKTVRDRYLVLLDRIKHTSVTSLINAICEFSPWAGNEEITDLAELIIRHPWAENDRGNSFDQGVSSSISALAEEWGNRLLASDDTARSQLSLIAELICRAPSVGLLRLLKQLIDEDLRRFRVFREEAKMTDWRQGRVANEARTVYTHTYQKAFLAIKAPETDELMREFLEDEHFGECAAAVLAARWTAANEPKDSERFQIGPDFSRIKEKRLACANEPSATSEEADAIFNVIEKLIADEATESQKKHAVALSIVAARLPHGQRDITIRNLLSIASFRSRAALLQSLILSGEFVDIEMVKSGIAEVINAAKEQSWILSGECYELMDWLRLLPYVDRPSEVFDVIRSLPDDLRSRERLKGIFPSLSTAPGEDAENVLFQLAEVYPKLYSDYAWCDAVMRRGTLTAAWRLVELLANGTFDGQESSFRNMGHQLSGMIDEYPELRTHVYQLLQDVVMTPGLALLAQAVAETPDMNGLLLLVKLEVEHKRSFIWYRPIEKIVTMRRPSEDWDGSYEIVPVASVELRQKLFAMTTDGGPADVAAHYLNQIDEIRDEYGKPDYEPRHPDLTSGKPWPIMAALKDISPIV
jgi:hypothetical protein